MKRKKIIYVILSIFIPIIMYIYLHSTATRAIRTYIFFTGNPLQAFRIEINRTSVQYDGKVFYSVSDFQTESGVDVSHFFVERKGLLYSATYGNP